MTLAEWIAAAAPPPPVNPLPLALEPGQTVRPLLIDFECNDFRALEPIEMTVQCLITGKVFTTLIKCEHAIHYRAWQVHGISKKMLHNEPQFPAIFDLLREWLVYVGSEEGEVLVFLAHKAAFDLRVMRNALPLPSQATGCFMTPSKLSRNIALTSPATRSESWRTH